MKYNITKTEEIEQYTIEQLQAIDKALVAAAYKIRDSARSDFENNSKYKNLKSLSDGIMLGKLQNSEITLHAYGNKSNYNSYKTRFFAGGTMERYVKTRNGKALSKPYSVGQIDDLHTIEKAMKNNENLVYEFIKTVLK